MEKKPLVSIPLLTYNGEKYIKEQLDSIFSQTYTNIEIIVFDDASTDNTVEILKTYEKKENFSYHINKKNVGLRENSLLAFKACTGDLIAPADQDDIWKKNKIELLVDNIGNNTLIYTDSTPIDSDGKELAPTYFSQFLNLIDGNDNKAFFFTNSISAHAMLFKKELLEYMFKIPDKMFYHDWWIAFIAASYGNIKFFDEPLIYYRRHEKQITKNKDKNYKSIFARIKEREDSILKNRQDIVNALESFTTLDIIDKDTEVLLNELIKYFKNFKSKYFDKSLYKLLLKYKDSFFAMRKDTDPKKAAKRLARGLWHYRLKLYT